MKYITLFLLIIGSAFQIEAQGIRRSTISSTGMISQTNGIRISSSFGQQCVGCSVLESPDGVGYLRQGYQQPNPNLTPCGFNSAIAIEPLVTECGTYYNFEYLGDAPTTGVEFYWEFGPSAAPSFSTEQNPMDVAFAVPGNYIISVTVTVPDECEEEVSGNFGIENTGFSALVESSRVSCFGDSDGALVIEGFGGTEPYSITWADSPTTDRIRTNLPAGDYPFTIFDSNGCQWDGVGIVDGPSQPVAVVPVAVIPESCTNTQDGRIEIDVITGGESFTISWSNGVNSSVNDNLSSGSYSVTITDTNGCAADTSFTLLNICEDGEEGLFDIITPNNDGVNDTWTIPGIENFSRPTVEIFNRWGTLVWDTRNYVNNSTGNAFSGISNDGKTLPTGAYYYVIQYNDKASTIHSGAVTVIR